MKIINKETGAILEASDEIARGYLKNPSFVQLKEELPVKKRARKGGVTNGVERGGIQGHEPVGKLSL